MDSPVHFTSLSETSVLFEPLSKLTKVFYDHTCQQVFSVRSGGATGVVVRSLDPAKNHEFRMEDKGPLLSIKLSPNQEVLSLQRERNIVDFHSFHFKEGSDVLPEIAFSQRCKNKSAVLKGFIWSSESEVIFVTDVGIEVYQLQKNGLKLTKSIVLQSLAWFLHHPSLSFLLCYTPPSLHSFLCKPVSSTGSSCLGIHTGGSSIVRLPKLEFTPSHTSQNSSPDSKFLTSEINRLSELDVTVGEIYGQISVLVILPTSNVTVSTSSVASSSSLQIQVFVFAKDFASVRLKHILMLDFSGCLALNIIDSLVLVHHQNSQTSVVFDVALPSDSDGYLQYHKPLFDPVTMKPAFLTAPGPSTSGGANKTPVQMYSMNWVIRQPNIIIDAKIGRIWTSELNIQGAIDLMRDPIRKVAFIIARSLPDAKDKLLAELRKMIVYRTVGLLEIGKIFDLINDVYRRKLEQRLAQCPPVFREPPSLMISSEGVHSLAPEYVSSPPSPLDAQQKIVLDQGDLLNQVFSPAFRQAEEQATTFVTREKERKGRLPFVHKALVEYIRSLTQVQIPVNHYIFELLLNGMIRNGAFYQMDQLLHYKAIPDSKPMACLLLSLSKVYPPAQQTALDMLLRLETATEEIIEVLLENDHVVPALRFLRDYVDHLDVIWRRKFLEAAERSNDSMAVHAMKSFFDGEPPLITF